MRKLHSIIAMLSGLLFCLASCQRMAPVEDYDGEHNCELRLVGGVVPFDGGTKAGGEFTPTNDNRIYVRMVAGDKAVLGVAKYDEANAAWSFTYNGSLGGATQGSAHAVLFARSFTESSLQVTCSFVTPIYEDANASFAVSDGAITLTTQLAPKTGRLTFVHDSPQNTGRWIGRMAGISYYSSFNLADFTFQIHDGIESDFSQEHGTANEYLYGFFTDPEDPVVWVYGGDYYCRHFSKEVLLPGRSGYVNHPEENLNGWIRYWTNLYTGVGGRNGSAGVQFSMKYVPAGTFQMGSTQQEAAKPVHQVTLPHYYIGEKEVTRDVWYNVMGEPSDWANNIAPVSDRTYDQIQEFIKKLNETTGNRFRLPTEAEWEFAARGGIYSKGYMYSGGDKLDEVAIRWSDLAVGARKANELEIYDMSGDVAEFCADWYGPYSEGAQTSPTGPASGQQRVLRGGNRYDDDHTCAVWYRSSIDIYTSSYDVGFRLAMDVPPYTY